MIPRIGSRRWIAWKLVQLAARIYDAEYYERLLIASGDEELLEIFIIGDLYGCGISSTHGLNPGGTRELPNCTIHWDDDYEPDWL
ncbi:hypothetical protein SEA_NIHILNOMEN_154 [Mycobacterium phage NihilNomen]|nr:hypothetical protein SEA_NIHILNOMEN_154 [Mycobacterium phage NihilNomen]